MFYILGTKTNIYQHSIDRKHGLSNAHYIFDMLLSIDRYALYDTHFITNRVIYKIAT